MVFTPGALYIDRVRLLVVKVEGGGEMVAVVVVAVGGDQSVESCFLAVDQKMAGVALAERLFLLVGVALVVAGDIGGFAVAQTAKVILVFLILGALAVAAEVQLLGVFGSGDQFDLRVAAEGAE